MATLIITGVSAVQFWLDYSKRSSKDSYYYKVCPRSSLPKNCDFKIDSETAELLSSELGINLPVHLYVENINQKHFSKVIRFSVLPKYLPAKSFIKLEKYQLPLCLHNYSIYVASPEFCFLQRACDLPFHRLVELGCNLCAGYAYDSYSSLSQVFRVPVCSANKIINFLKTVHNIRGVTLAKRAMRYICDGSKEKVIVEYDSNLTHLNKSQHSYDKNKAAALTDSGYKVIPFTAKAVNDFYSIETNFTILRRALHKRSRNNLMTLNEEKRRNVFLDLFNSEKLF